MKMYETKEQGLFQQFSPSLHPQLLTKISPPCRYLHLRLIGDGFDFYAKAIEVRCCSVRKAFVGSLV